MVYGRDAFLLLRIAQSPEGLLVPRRGGGGLRVGRGAGLRRRDQTLWWRLGESRAVGELSPFSGGLAVGAAWLVGAYGPSFCSWPLGSFVATAVYLSVVGAENTISELAGAGSGGDER